MSKENTCELNQYGKLDVDWFHYFIANCYTFILSVHSEKKFSTADCYMKISLVMERPAGPNFKTEMFPLT